MKKKIVMLWVHPDFKSRINVESAKNNESIIEYTKKLSKMKSLIEEDEENNFEKKRFSFRL